MLRQFTNLFTWSKAVSRRVTHLVLATFMLQIVAAGFCVTLVNAAPEKQLLAASHCNTASKQMSSMGMTHTAMDDKAAAHACSHCDLPDVNITFEKTAFSTADFAADLFVLTTILNISDVAMATFTESPPGLSTSLTPLQTFHLNLRIRV